MRFFVVVAVASAWKAKHCPRSQEPVDKKLKVLVPTAFGEGIGSWRIAMSELLALARVTNTTLVEPCVKNGRLGTGKCKAHGYPLRTVFDWDTMNSIARLMTLEEFENRTFTSSDVVCIHSGPPVTACGKLTSIHRTNETCPSALVQRAEVLYIHVYRRDGLWGIDKSHIDDVKARLTFAPVHTTIARHIVKQFGFDLNEYVAFQWRSETHHDQIQECAQALIDAKEKGLGIQGRVLLISDLTLDPAQMWGGIRRHGIRDQMAIVLDSLKEHNFTKPLLDDHFSGTIATTLWNLGEGKSVDPNFLNDVDKFNGTWDIDMVFYGIWDSLIAANARKLATCHNCPHWPCADCMWQAHFVEMVIDLRNTISNQADTHTCWPTPKNDTFPEPFGQFASEFGDAIQTAIYPPPPLDPIVEFQPVLSSENMYQPAPPSSEEEEEDAWVEWDHPDVETDQIERFRDEEDPEIFVEEIPTLRP